VIDARTEAVAAPDAATAAVTAEATDNVDSTLERYGYIPTLTLRLGLDLI
jgi:hypothetical protein